MSYRLITFQEGIASAASDARQLAPGTPTASCQGSHNVPAIDGITSVLVAHGEGQSGAFDQLVGLVYPELRRIARQQLGRWRGRGTLDTSAVVNEAYLKLIDQTRASWKDRNHFFAIAARAMRQVLIDHARRRHSQKRGGGLEQTALDGQDVAIQTQVEDLLTLDELLGRLEAVEPRLLQVVECRFFAGYSESETAAALDISTRTVEREWLRAKAWLRAAAGQPASPMSPRFAAAAARGPGPELTRSMPREDDLDRLLVEALQQPSDQRQAFLESRCANDPEFRALLSDLLRESDDSDPYLKAGGAFAGPLWDDLLTGSSGVEPGTRFGPYEIRSPLGSGGMGEVYRAHDTRLGRDVAIKMLPSDTPATAHALARFEREARAVAALNHPNILAIHDVGSEHDLRYVVTELLEGETLRQRLGRGAVPPSRAIEYAVQIAHGLGAAHDRGIVHRDIKPDNLFITRDGRLKILDFGIASFEEAPGGAPVTQLTKSGIIPGTVGYTSPEQMMGNPATPQSDLFAFGIVLHEMLTGVHPFVRATAPETLTAVLRDDPSPVLHTLPDVPATLVRVVERCLQKAPGDRFETARDVAFFLEAVPGAEITREASAVFRIPSLRALRPRLLALTCGLVLLLTAAMWSCTRVIGTRAVRATADATFVRAERSVRRMFGEQVARLTVTAQLVASFPELKALFATDAATIQDFLLGYQQRLADAPALIALGPDGSEIGRTNNAGPPAADTSEWAPPLLAAPAEGTIVTIGKRPHVAVAVASEAGGRSMATSWRRNRSASRWRKRWARRRRTRWCCCRASICSARRSALPTRRGDRWPSGAPARATLRDRSRSRSDRGNSPPATFNWRRSRRWRWSCCDRKTTPRHRSDASSSAC